MALVKLGDKAVGSVVKLKVNGADTEFLVVHQGLPGSMYDASCDGTWLLVKNCWGTQVWSSSGRNDYEQSDANSYLNTSVYSSFDADIRAQIRQVKIPYRSGSGLGTGVRDGSQGLSTKLFLLSAREVGFTTTNGNNAVCNDGAKLDYFNNGGNTSDSGCQKRIAYYGGTAAIWWLRTPCPDTDYSAYNALRVFGDGRVAGGDCTISGNYMRFALILPPTLGVTDDGTVINNTAPTVPGSITMPEAVQGGQPLAVSWGASSDGENNLAGYSLERQVDGGEWAAVYSGPELSFTDAITKGWQTVAYRVRAYDTASAYSGFAVSETRQVNNNTPPVITCEIAANTNLGVKSEGFAIPYSVADEEGDDVTVTEAVDGTILRTFTATLGGANSLQLTGEDFMKLLNGRHTLTVTADDGASSAAHVLSFSKEVTAAGVTLAQPMEADGPISVCVLAVSGFIPADADYQVEVTGNALDDEPVWEDCTAAVWAGANHVFAHKTAANGPAFNFRLNVSRGSSGVGGYITSVQGGFQGA